MKFEFSDQGESENLSAVREIILPREFKAKILQIGLSIVITIASYQAKGINGLDGFPIGFSRTDIAVCQGLGCPSEAIASLVEPLLVLNLIFWYLVLGLIKSAYKRWKE